MGYFLVHGFHFERVDVLELAADEHGCNADQVQVVDVELSVAALKVPVHQRHCMEEGQVVAAEVCQNLDHPVDHASPHLAIDTVIGLHVMLGQALSSVELGLLLQALQMLDDVVREFAAYHDILAVYVCRLVARNIFVHGQP